MTKIILGYLQSGEKVYDRTPSHIHESAKPYVKEALGKVNSDSREWILGEKKMNYYSE
jgi:hypothetical protein